MKNTRQVIIQSEADADKSYTVTKRDDGSYHCTCEAFHWRTGICKHIKKVIDNAMLANKPAWLDQVWLQEDIQAKRGFTKYFEHDNKMPDVTTAYGARYVVATKTIAKFREDGTLFYKNSSLINALGKPYYFGGWWDETKQEYVVEAVTVYGDSNHSLDSAMKRARECKQCYIFDLETGRDLSVSAYVRLIELKSQKELLVQHMKCLYDGWVESNYDYDKFQRAWNESADDLKTLNKRITLLTNNGGFA